MTRNPLYAMAAKPPPGDLACSKAALPRKAARCVDRGARQFFCIRRLSGRARAQKGFPKAAIRLSPKHSR
ncbi:hypothetical protein ACFB49_30610 [Sphingomonas sp. DBB INV C78]